MTRKTRQTPGDLSEAQWGLLREGVAEKMSQTDLYELLSEAGPCSRDAVREAVRSLKDDHKQKLAAKREGAEMIARFLDDAKNGAAGVDEMAALLEVVLARDILRRYAEQNEVMAGISFENLLKLDLSYRKVRLDRLVKERGAPDDAEAAPFAVRVALETLDLVAVHLAAPLSPELVAAVEGAIAQRYGVATLADAKAQRNELERLRAALRNPAPDDGKELHGRVA